MLSPEKSAELLELIRGQLSGEELPSLREMKSLPIQQHPHLAIHSINL